MADQTLYEATLPQMGESLGTVTAATEAGTASWSSAWSLMIEFIGKAIGIAKELRGLTGDELKEKVIEAAEKFYEEVIVPIDIPGVPNIIEPLVDKAIGKALRPLIAGAVDGILKLYDRLGWPAFGFGDKPEAASS